MKFSHSLNSMIIRFMSRKSYPISLVLKSRSSEISHFRSLVGVRVRHVSTNAYQNHFHFNPSPGANGFPISCPSLIHCRNRFNCFGISSIGYSSTSMAYTTDERGAHNSTDYRVYFKNNSGEPLSPWHDIPIFADEPNRIYNMVVEIPRWTNAKMEISTKEPLNPIKQDVKKGVLRYVRNPFPHKGYIWNYGAIPQTWEDPKHLDEATGCKGDNDPIDIVEIGSRVANRGEILKVKILGVMALIDEGETDWKLIAIDVEDPLADQLNDIEDVEMLMPGLIKATHEWFKIYKIPDGKPPNEFAFNGEAKNREFAEKIIAETHKYWKDLVGSSTNETELDLKNTTLSNSYKIDGQKEGLAIINQNQESANMAALPITDQTAIDKWYYITLA